MPVLYTSARGLEIRAEEPRRSGDGERPSRQNSRHRRQPRCRRYPRDLSPRGGVRDARRATSDEGLKLVSVSRPDLVLLDILMPGMNGIEVLKRIRSINPTTKVIMVTGNADLRLAREALELGAVAYVDKPFDLAYLKRVVAMALRSKTETT